MRQDEAKKLANSLIASKTDIYLYGEGAKTSLIFGLFPDAVLLNSSEFLSASPQELLSTISNCAVLIIKEQIATPLETIGVFIEEKRILNRKISSTLVLIGKEKKEFSNCVPIHLEKPTKEEWLSWAESARVDRGVIEIVSSSDIYDLYPHKKLSLLGSVLAKRINNQHLKEIIGSIIEEEKIANVFVEMIGSEKNSTETPSIDDLSEYKNYLLSIDPDSAINKMIELSRKQLSSLQLQKLLNDSLIRRVIDSRLEFL